ncbi:protein LYK2-like [Salvia divinorum]|uniref:Protein LYK2-like n=1 Tax=Salvia divinorum TaxID=28513 RepID=A0ABD1HAX3_SALDI
MMQLTVFVFFHLVITSALSLNCDKSPSSQDYQCLKKIPDQKCNTYAILHANSHYSSLSNLTSLLSTAPADLLEDNAAFSNSVNFLIPIQCKCSSNGFFTAELRKISVKGESFSDIAESLEGLTSCSAIKARNPSIPPWNLPEGESIIVPVKCACPASDGSGKFLVTYPVKEGDTLTELAAKFNVTRDLLVSANAKYSALGFRQGDNLVPTSTLVIPSQGKPILGFLERPEESIRVKKQRRRRRRRRKTKKWIVGVFVAIGVIGFLACIGVGLAFFFTNMRKKREEESSMKKKRPADVEMQQLSLSIRTTSDKKVSFEGSQYNLEEATPHKSRVESYAFEDLHKATEGFSSSNLIAGSVFQGRFNGKNVAVKRVSSEKMRKVDYEVVNGAIHRHPNIMAMLGTCFVEGSDSFIVFEYAKNGSLKDWIHGGLAIKSHFIASCSCFLTWNQRVKICLDAATALQHMHHIMNPSYIHGNVRSRNIFLDEDFTAKLGLAKLGDDQESDSGYLAPEFVGEGTVSTGTDVFALGVVLLEVISGKPPVARDGAVKVSDEIKRILETGELRGWMDGALGESYCFDAAVMLANLARSCVEDDVSLRPNAGEIVEKLLRLVEELPEMDQLS